MMGLKERELKKYGFVCVQSDEEEEMYYLETGKYTALFVEGKREPHEENDEEFYFGFYKVNHYNGETVVFAEHLDCVEIIKRVERYFYARNRYIAEQKYKEKAGEKHGMGTKHI